MTDRAACLDTNVVIKHLVPEEGSDQATQLVRTLVTGNVTLVSPSWAWAEVGSVLRKKMASRLLRQAEADEAWQQFLRLPVVFLDDLGLRDTAWRLARDRGLPSLYDAAFLACVEVVGAERCDFWTADRELLRQLRARRPAYVRELGT